MNPLDTMTPEERFQAAFEWGLHWQTVARAMEDELACSKATLRELSGVYLLNSFVSRKKST